MSQFLNIRVGDLGGEGSGNQQISKMGKKSNSQRSEREATKGGLTQRRERGKRGNWGERGWGTFDIVNVLGN